MFSADWWRRTFARTPLRDAIRSSGLTHTTMLFHPATLIRVLCGLLFLFSSPGCSRSHAQVWQSAVVFFGQDGKLVYVSDAEGNRIPDFSYAGYRNSEVPIPDVPVVKTVSPLAGDNTTHLQAAIDEVAMLPLNADGFRGAILLGPGVYRIAGTILLNASGLVLRGSGEGGDSTTNTILLATGNSPAQRTVLVAGGPSQTKWQDQVSDTKTDIISDIVLVGGRSFEVANAAPLAVGDNIVIYHPCTDAWLLAIDSGGTAMDAGWKLNEQPIVYNRYVTAIDRNIITIDAPVFNHLIRSISQSSVYRYARTNLRTRIGLERLRIDIEAAGVTTDPNGDENHAWDAVLFQQVEDAWARAVTTLHFGQSGFKTATATRITIDSCSALDPVCIITGERRYNFNTYTASQLILFSNCRATYGRHDFVSNGTSWVSGNVFHNCRSSFAYASSEGHRRWSQGMLFDNVAFSSRNTGIILGLYNRGDYGTGHGWGAVHSVAWNVDAGGGNVIIQKPPTAQNYAIGCSGTITGTGPFAQPVGYIEGSNTTGLEPVSLYAAQLHERLSGMVSAERFAQDGTVPAAFLLRPNYPNPFNPSTTIAVDLPLRQRVRITIHDVLGRVVDVLAEGCFAAGTHRFGWEARGRPSGVYLCRLQGEYGSAARKIVLTK